MQKISGIGCINLLFFLTLITNHTQFSKFNFEIRKNIRLQGKKFQFGNIQFPGYFL